MGNVELNVKPLIKAVIKSIRLRRDIKFRNYEQSISKKILHRN